MWPCGVGHPPHMFDITCWSFVTGGGTLDCAAVPAVPAALLPPCSLEGLSTLHSLRALRCSCNPLASLTGVEA